ncbi:MAG: hypothetical protein P4L33_00195 [Capsulimonadaceae bacterium]|nr:hypothetical protein [Capsulimonadaceae bacterium]
MSLFDRRTPAAPGNEWNGTPSDFYGYVCYEFPLDRCVARVVEPRNPLPGRPWVWRTMFWDSFPIADVAFLKAGLYVAYIEVGNTFGCPDAMKYFDVFYAFMTAEHGMAKRPALEGLSRGGLYAYRWAHVNTDKVGCLYGDAPVCDMKSWPGGKGIGAGSVDDWRTAIECYHFSGEQEMLDFTGNPIDTLAPLAAADIPIIHVTGDSDGAVPQTENTDVARERYLMLGGRFVLIVKQGCDHHPHGLNDPTPVVNYILAHTAGGQAAEDAAPLAPPPGTVITLTPEEWQREGVA